MLPNVELAFSVNHMPYINIESSNVIVVKDRIICIWKKIQVLNVDMVAVVLAVHDWRTIDWMEPKKIDT